MICCLESLRKKEVIELRTGEILGCIDDAEIDTGTGTVRSFMIYGRPRLFGIFGREEDLSVPCSAIKVIGRETILVDMNDSSECMNKRKKSFKNLFE